MQKYQDVVLKPDGTVIQGASVLVQSYPAGVTSTIYSDDGVTTQANPMTTDSLGGFSFYAAGGQYQLVISGNEIATKTITDIQLGEETEGTWTPTDVSGGTATMTLQAGEWLKQGSMVFISGQFRFLANSDATAAAIGGLPFPAKAGTRSYSIACSSQGNTFGTTISGTQVGGLMFSIAAGTSVLTPRFADVPGLLCPNGSLDVATIQFSGWYRTD
jgi:hypothetical protein